MIQPFHGWKLKSLSRDCYKVTSQVKDINLYDKTNIIQRLIYVTTNRTPCSPENLEIVFHFLREDSKEELQSYSIKYENRRPQHVHAVFLCDYMTFICNIGQLNY